MATHDPLAAEGPARRTPGEVLIEVDHLYAGYDGTAILDDVSFDIRAGEVFGILGGSGGGKSTLISLVMAFNLAAFIGPKASLSFGLFAGAAAGLGWVAMSMGVTDLFEQRSLKLWLINSGYQVLTYTLMGGVLGVWK